MRSFALIFTLLLSTPIFAADAKKPRDLFNGKDLAGWKITDFGGEGEVKVKDGEIVQQAGSSLSGVHYTNDLPKVNYEISLEAKKIEGSDFFCALTFPVNDTHCTLVLGGWGGGVVGLSSIDGMDASENDTTKFMAFKPDVWHKIRLRVEPERIRAWIDNDPMIDQDIKGHAVTLRFGPIDLQKPLGLSTYQTSAAWKNIKLTEFPAGEKLSETSDKPKK